MNERKMMINSNATGMNMMTATRPVSGDTFQSFVQDVSKAGEFGQSSLYPSNLMSTQFAQD